MADRLKNKTAPSFWDLCNKVNKTEEVVDDVAEAQCKLGDESWCLDPAPPKCEVSARPIDFVYERKTDSYNMEPYKTSDDIIAKV